MKKFLSLAILGVFVISFISGSSAMHKAWRHFPEEEVEYKEVLINKYDEHILWAPRRNPQAEMERAAAYRIELENKEAMGTITENEAYELLQMRLGDNEDSSEAAPPLDNDFLNNL